jgi:hypothetical protein
MTLIHQNTPDDNRELLDPKAPLHGRYAVTPPVYNDGDATELQTDNNGLLKVAIAGGNVTVSGGKPVGAASLANKQVTVASTATLIAAARTGASGTGRVSITVYNAGSVTVFVGTSTVTASGATGGIPVPAGGAVTFDTTAALYGITASSTALVGVAETF